MYTLSDLLSSVLCTFGFHSYVYEPDPPDRVHRVVHAFAPTDENGVPGIDPEARDGDLHRCPHCGDWEFR